MFADFLGFHKLIDLTGVITSETTLADNTLGTCFAFCGDDTAAGIAVILETNCKCMAEGASYKRHWWKILDQVTGNVLTAKGVGAQVMMEADTGSDDQLWSWEDHYFVAKSDLGLGLRFNLLTGESKLWNTSEEEFQFYRVLYTKEKHFLGRERDEVDGRWKKTDVYASPNGAEVIVTTEKGGAREWDLGTLTD